ncbi:hypothetical protein CR513_45764, partial [Mucuna pruriens]
MAHGASTKSILIEWMQFDSSPSRASLSEASSRPVKKNLKGYIESSNSFNYVSPSVNNSFATNYKFLDCKLNYGENKFEGLEHMENQDQTLKLATPDVIELAQSYELKFNLIHLLLKFHGLASEDPHKHLKEFHMVCSMMRPQGIPKDYMKMKAFPFSLDGAAKDWLYLQPVPFRTWGI